MDHASLAAYDATRDFSQKAVRSLCYAPFTNLFFDRLGDVRVCCWNWQVPVGNVLRNSMDEIWHGPKIEALRRTLAANAFAKGCDFCQFQTAEGVFAGVKMRQFDRFAVTGEDPQWPKQMEFSISNACNLECVMCDGNHSSAIRAHREKRPPMPRIYSDAFLDSMRAYLPHLTQAKFLGGEPFLVVEHFRLWDMMIADGVKTLCHVTTNGTQYSERIERVLAAIPFGFSISLDAVTKRTYESIRVNAVFEEVMANARRFREYVRERKTSFSFTYCLMSNNWREFGEFCLMADQWEAAVGINTVRTPPELGIYTMPVSELRKILDGMERQAPELSMRLKRNKAVWFDELERIRAKVRAGEAKVSAAAAAS
jgi:MoaA/NifB/PqqE/SkfB family radical SAM enzyme